MQGGQKEPVLPLALASSDMGIRSLRLMYANKGSEWMNNLTEESFQNMG